MGNYATQHSAALRSKIWWGAGFAAFGVIDLWRASKDDKSTFSDCIRDVFCTDTPLGRAVFLAGLAVFARHILK